MYNPNHSLTREQVDGKRLYATPDGRRDRCGCGESFRV
jgi:hypothetical protein